MGWGDPFLEAIRLSAFEPRFVVEQVNGIGFVPVGSFLQLSTHDEGPYHAQIIARDGHRAASQELRPGSWTSTAGEITLSLIEPVTNVAAIARGMLLQVRCGVRGWSTADYEPILTGRLVGYGRSGTGRWDLTIRSALSTLASRATLTSGQSDLFYDVPYETTLSAAYAPADANVQVASTSGARETGGSYLLEITPDSGDPFLITATGTAAGPIRFTGCSATAWLGTTAAAASSGNAVRVLAYIEEHPVDAARKLLLSTGGASPSAYDTLPAAWGLGLTDDCVDHDECDLSLDMLNSGTSPVLTTSNWSIYSEGPQSDPYSWMQSWLAPAGLFLCDHQGRISVRPAISPGFGQFEIEFVLESEIVEIDRYDCWEPNQVVEYSRHRVKTWDASLNTDEQIDSVPAQWKWLQELSFVQGSSAAWRGNVAERTAPWVLRLAERVELTLMGFRLAKLGIGSGCYFASTKLVTRINDLQIWQVLACEPDWFGSTTRLVLGRVSEDSAE